MTPNCFASSPGRLAGCVCAARQSASGSGPFISVATAAPACRGTTGPDIHARAARNRCDPRVGKGCAMRLSLLLALIVMEACIVICGGGGADDERFAGQCMQPPLPADMLYRIYDGAVAAAAAEAREEDEPALDDL